MRGGWGQEWCHPSVPRPKLLMYASGEPRERSNYWITARSEVVTSKTEGDSPSPFVSLLGVRRSFFSLGSVGEGKGMCKVSLTLRRDGRERLLLPLQSSPAVGESALLACALWQQHWQERWRWPRGLLGGIYFVQNLPSVVTEGPKSGGHFPACLCLVVPLSL